MPRRWAVSGVLVTVIVATAVARGKVARVDPSIVAVIERQFAGWAEASRTSKPPAVSVYAPHASIAMTGTTVSPQVTNGNEVDSKWTVFGPARVTRHKVRDVRAGIAADGRSAWLSFLAKVGVDGLHGTGTWNLRASQLLFKTTDGWQVGAGVWSLGQQDRALARATQAGVLPALEPIMDQDVGPRDVLAALDRFVANGFEKIAPSRADIVAIGTSQAAAVVGGKAVLAAYARAWTGKARREGAAWAITAPSGTTASVTANVQLTRGKGDRAFELPARLFVVFDKDAQGEWVAVHAHLASPAPAP